MYLSPRSNIKPLGKLLPDTALLMRGKPGDKQQVRLASQIDEPGHHSMRKTNSTARPNGQPDINGDFPPTTGSKVPARSKNPTPNLPRPRATERPITPPPA